MGILCKDYFQRFVPAGSTVLEIGAGYCEFINSISPGKKIAVDINPETLNKARNDVEVIIAKSTDLASINQESIDVIFVSNFFEHLCRDDIVETLKECFRVLKEGGRILILQPNIRFVQRDYWMFFDHVTPVDDRPCANF